MNIDKIMLYFSFVGWWDVCARVWKQLLWSNCQFECSSKLCPDKYSSTSESSRLNGYLSSGFSGSSSARYCLYFQISMWDKKWWLIVYKLPQNKSVFTIQGTNTYLDLIDADEKLDYLWQSFCQKIDTYMSRYLY